VETRESSLIDQTRETSLTDQTRESSLIDQTRKSSLIEQTREKFPDGANQGEVPLVVVFFSLVSLPN
jgi:hypothetical protein